MTWKQLEELDFIHNVFLYPFYHHDIFPLNRVDFENLKEIPILVLDVNEDFKNDKIKQEYLMDKVSTK